VSVSTGDSSQVKKHPVRFEIKRTDSCAESAQTAGKGEFMEGGRIFLEVGGNLSWKTVFFKKMASPAAQSASGAFLSNFTDGQDAAIYGFGSGEFGGAEHAGKIRVSHGFYLLSVPVQECSSRLTQYYL
jgi:hypothetical protein